MNLFSHQSKNGYSVRRPNQTVWLLLCLVITSLGWHEASAQKTDVVLIVADGFKWNDASIHQQTEIQTPNIDSIGKEGIRADRYIVTEPGDASLAAILTGRYAIASRVKAKDNEQKGGERFEFDDSVVGRVFKRNGYRTGWFGRWPFDRHYEQETGSLGFEAFVRSGNGNSGEGQRSSNNSSDQKELLAEVGERNDSIISEFGAFLAQKPSVQGDSRYLAVIAPFTYQITDTVPPAVVDILGLDGENERDKSYIRSAVSAHEADRLVGGILDAIAVAKPENEPLVIFTSTGTTASGAEMPWLDVNQEGIDEGGTRVPFFIKGKWIAAGKMIVPPIADIDVFPSLKVFCSLLKEDSDRVFDGISMAALAYGLPMRWKDRMLFQFARNSGKAGAVRTIEWRAVRSPGSDEKWRLYHMFIDPRQSNNVAGENAEEVTKFSQGLETAFEAFSVGE